MEIVDVFPISSAKTLMLVIFRALSKRDLYKKQLKSCAMTLFVKLYSLIPVLVTLAHFQGGWTSGDFFSLRIKADKASFLHVINLCALKQSTIAVRIDGTSGVQSTTWPLNLPFPPFQLEDKSLLLSVSNFDRQQAGDYIYHGLETRSISIESVPRKSWDTRDRETVDDGDGEGSDWRETYHFS